MIDWTSWMDYGFMKMALAAILIITPLFGLMGTMIVNKKMAYFSDALGHSALTQPLVRRDSDAHRRCRLYARLSL